MRRLFCLLSLLTATAFAGDSALTWERLPPLPEPLGVAAPFAGVSGGVLLVAGGANFPEKMPWEGGKKVWHDKVWMLERPDGAWREVGKLPRPLAYGVCVTAQDSVVCVGGSDSERHYADAFLLRWKDGKLQTETLPPLPIALSGASGAVAGEMLYVACGTEKPGEKAATNRAFEMYLSAAQPVWRELPALPGKPRLLAAGATLKGSRSFYVLGGAALIADPNGKTVREYLREAWSYHPDGGWSRRADLPRASVAAPSPAPTVDGRILLIAGDDGSRVGFEPADRHPGFPGGILEFHPTPDYWREAGTTPAPRATVPCVEWRGRFVIPSGEVRPGVRSPEVWSFSAR